MPASVSGFHSCGFIIGKTPRSFSVCQATVFVVASEFLLMGILGTHRALCTATISYHSPLSFMFLPCVLLYLVFKRQFPFHWGTFFFLMLVFVVIKAQVVTQKMANEVIYCGLPCGRPLCSLKFTWSALLVARLFQTHALSVCEGELSLLVLICT